MKQRILFVCLGNICRSPAAEGILRDLLIRRGLTDQIEVDSAGTYAGHTGELADPRMRRAASARGIELTHRARQIREADFERFDRIIVMDDYNYEDESFGAHGYQKQEFDEESGELVSAEDDDFADEEFADVADDYGDSLDE